eukprot:765035-Hanusia_phi.AAC.13
MNMFFEIVSHVWSLDFKCMVRVKSSMFVRPQVARQFRFFGRHFAMLASFSSLSACIPVSLLPCPLPQDLISLFQLFLCTDVLTFPRISRTLAPQLGGGRHGAIAAGWKGNCSKAKCCGRGYNTVGSSSEGGRTSSVLSLRLQAALPGSGPASVTRAGPGSLIQRASVPGQSPTHGEKGVRSNT